MSAGPKKPSEGQKQTTSEFGTVTAPGTFRIERVLPGPIERVWAYLTDPEKRRTWLASGMMDLRVGGQVELRFRFAELSAEKTPPDKSKECDVNGRITRCDPPRVLSYTWGDEPGSSEVTFELFPRDGHVVLVITHQRLDDREKMVSIASGWHTHLGIFADHLNAEVPRAFWATKVQMEAEYKKRFAVLRR